ncbi:MAG TPA: hypothetical protein VF993_06230 [Myxococcales bacterium]
MTQAQRIAAFLAKFDPEIARQARAARRKLRRMMPTAVELIYDNYNALVFGFAPDEHASGAILSIALYPRWVTLFFLQGRNLPDPEGLLEGAGQIVRSIRLESERDLDKPPVRALMAQAIARAREPLPAKGRGRTVIRSVSATQRPRR